MPTTRPADPSDRARCGAAAAVLRRQPRRSRLLEAALDDFDERHAAWRAAGAEAAIAEARERAAGAAQDAAHRVFAAAFRCWAATVRDEEGKPRPRAIAGLLGGMLPGELLRRTPGEALTRTCALALQRREDPSLAGDAARFQALWASIGALRAATEAAAAARARAGAARRALAPTGAAFDRAWGVVAREAQRLGGEIACAIPVFAARRRSREPMAPWGSVDLPDEGDTVRSDEATAAVEPGAPANGAPAGRAAPDRSPADVRMFGASGFPLPFFIELSLCGGSSGGDARGVVGDTP